MAITYVTGIAFSLLIWSTAEGFGGPYTAGSADIGTAIIYALVDAVIERKVSWWYRIAEVGHGSAVQQPLVMAPTEATAADEAAA